MTDSNQKLSKTSINTTVSNGHTTSTSTHKKHKRNRNRGKKKSANVVQVNRAPEKEYLSLCHNVSAKKPKTGNPLTVKGGQDGSIKHKSDPTQVRGLGGWRCSECGKPCKVKVQKITEVANEAPNETIS